MSKRAYLPHLCDTELKLALQSSGAILIEGAKWCGKSSTAFQFASISKAFCAVLLPV